jgi:molybdopterin-guanine dinucleotide biosynthesis protein A
MSFPPPPHGLLLAGGCSSRMGKDKSAIRYAGTTQPELAAELLRSRCAEIFLSLRKGQNNATGLDNLSVVHDRWESAGPLIGILSAMTEHPEAAWLVIACDLPFLDGITLDNLLAQRDPTKMATAYRSSSDGKPEPLCTIYEAHARLVLEDFFANDIRCPRKILMQTEPLLLDPVNPRALDNVNTPEDYEEAVHTFSKR